MPRDSDKNNNSRGRRDRPGSGKGRAGGGKGRSGAARGPEKKFAKRGFAGKGDGDKRDGERRPYAGKSDGAKSFGKKPYSGGGKPYAGKRDGDDRPPRRDFGDAPRPRGDGHLLAVRHAVTMVKSVRSSRVKIVAVATSARSSRAATVRISIATTVRRAGIARATLGIATMHVRLDVFPTGNLATRSPIPREKVAARSGPIRRAAKVFVKTATVRVAIGPLAPGRRAMAIAPVAIGLRENLAATRSSRAARPTVARARILVTVPIVVGTAAIQSRGRSARIAASAIPVPPVTVRAISTSRALIGPATTAAARSVRAFRVRARIARNSTVPARGRQAAPTGRSIRAVKRVTIGRVARTRTTARFLQNVRRSAAVAPIASASLNSTSARRSRRRVKKSGERIAKVVSRAGLASRRDAEEWITQGRVTVNGRVINSPALDVTANDTIAVDGKVLPPRERTRLFMYHKPRGLMTTHADPEGRPTVFDNLPEGLPRLISIGRLDFNTEGLLAADQ